MSSSSTNMSELEKKKKTSTSTIIPDWSLLPDELLHLISTHLHNCFDVVHARSVCCSWRSTFPFPFSLLRQTYSLPSFREYPFETKGLCTLEKVPLFLLRVPSPAVVADAVSPSEYFLGEIGQDDHMELPYPLQCSVSVKIPRSEPTLMNILDCEIIPMRHHYRMIGWIGNRVAFLPLDKEGKKGEFVVLVSYFNFLLVLTSAEMRWKRLQNVPNTVCLHIVTYRGRFYATFKKFGEIVVIDPYSLEVTLLLLSQPPERIHYKVALASGKDELFLVELIIPRGDLKLSVLAFRVSRLDEEAGKWVETSDLGHRLLCIGKQRNAFCSAKELPHGCGLSGNSILFTKYWAGNVNFSYKYGVNTRSSIDGDLWSWLSGLTARP